VATLLLLVPVSLGVIHQATAMVLFGVWLCWLHHVARAPAAERTGHLAECRGEHTRSGKPRVPRRRWPRDCRRRVPARPGAVDFAQAPYLVIWETTRSCDLACKHCRAEAVTHRHPLELTTAEAKRMMDDVRRFGRPLFVLTGGDPLKRPDVIELVVRRVHRAAHGDDAVRHAAHDGADPAQLREAGLSRLAVSLDGSTAAIHDAFRGVAGSYDWTIDMLRAARRSA
jgi:uncharacterized radical SAM superfamily Fe-S cluster-containing enzyme